MELTEILTLIFGSTSLVGIVTAIVYRRQNKKLKENEVKKDDVETQREQINLADEYMHKVLELSEMNYEQAKKNGIDNEEILKKIDTVAEEQKHIIMYLDGDYQEFLKRNGFKA